MLRRAGLGVVALLLAPHAAPAGTIWTLSDGPAHCSFARDGKPLGTSDLADGLSKPLGVEEETSQGDIVATCTRGNAAIVGTLRHRKIPGTYFSSCLAGEACRQSWAVDGTGYGPLLRLPFDRAQPAASPQDIVFNDGQDNVIVDLERKRVWLSAWRPDRENKDFADSFVTTAGTISAAQARQLSDLTAALATPGPPEPSQCRITSDLYGTLTVLNDEDAHSYSFSLTCENPQVRALVDAIICAAAPTQHDCPTRHRMGTRP